MPSTAAPGVKDSPPAAPKKRKRVTRSRTDFDEIRYIKRAWQARPWIGWHSGQQINLGLFTVTRYGEDVQYGRLMGYPPTDPLYEARGAEGAAAIAVREFHRLWDESAVRCGVPGASPDAFEVVAYLQTKVHRPRCWEPVPWVRPVLPKYARRRPDGTFAAELRREGGTLRLRGSYPTAIEACRAMFRKLGLKYPMLRCRPALVVVPAAAVTLA